MKNNSRKASKQAKPFYTSKSFIIGAAAALLVVIGLVVYLIYNSSSKGYVSEIDKINLSNSKYNYMTSMATVNNDVLSIEEYNYFVRKVRDERIFPQNIVSQNPDFTSQQTWDKVFDGRKLSDIAKDKAFELAVKYKVQAQKAVSNGIKLDAGDYDILNNEIKMNKTAGAGTVEEKQQFFRYRYGMSSEISYYSFIETMRKIDKLVYEEKAKISPATNELKAYYDSHIEKYKGVYGKKLRMITFSTVDANGEPLPQNKLNEVKSKANKALERAKKGEDFTSLVNEYSTSSKEKQNGGLRILKQWESDQPPFDMLWRWNNRFGNPSENYTFASSKTAIYIVKNEGFTDPEIPPFESIKGMVKTDVVNVAYDQLVEKWVKESSVKKDEKIFDAMKIPLR